MAIIKKYKAKVEEINNPLPDIYSISFSSPKKFNYLAGQFLHLALDSYDGIGQWPESRCFSMQSNPGDDFIKITFAAKGNFTGRMASELTPGREIWLKMPYGDIFQRGHEKNNCVFIAGGTGLTPFLSLFTNESFKEYVNPVLYSGFRSEEYNIFSSDLSTAKVINNSFSVNMVYQDKQGILDIEKIYNEKGNTTYFISGPPQMIKNFKNYLSGKGIPENKIITDDWE